MALNTPDRVPIQAKGVGAMPKPSPQDPSAAGEQPAACPIETSPPVQTLDSLLRLYRPLLPSKVFSVSATPREYEEFIRAIEEGRKAMQLRSVDLFE